MSTAEKNPGWIAGARSDAPLRSDGWFSFTVPQGVSGVVVGITDRDRSTEPDEPRHAFLFTAGTAQVIEQPSSRERTDRMPNTGGTYSIVRHGGTVLYCVGEAGDSITHPAAPFPLPGEVVYISQDKSYGNVFLDAALRAEGDRVDDAEMVDKEYNSVEAEFLPLQAFSSMGAYNAVDADLCSMAVEAGSESFAWVDAHLEPLACVASDVTHNEASVEFAPLVMLEKNIYDTANWVDISFESAYVYAFSQSGRNESDASFKSLAVAASEIDHNEAVIEFELPRLAAANVVSTQMGPFIDCVLPELSGFGPNDLLVEDMAYANDYTYPDRYALVVDGAFASDQLIAGAESVETVEDTALASAEVVLGASVLLEDVALASDELLPTASTMLVVGTALAGDELLPQSTGSVLVASGALAGGDALPYAFVDVEGVALASDDALIVSIVLLEDEALAGDEAITTSLRAQALLEDAALAGDELLAWTDSFALLQDVAVANEQLFMKTPGLVAWVMNTDTGAVSWYDNWAFTSMAVVGGKVFAAGPDGLHVIGGDLDGIDQIDARVQFGYTELGGYDQTGLPKPNEPKKRVQALWFGYHADGVLQATVETYGQGYGPYAYAMAPRAADQPRNNRIVPGKGLNARYWRIGVANTGGCAFEVHSIAAEVAQSTRRL